MPKPISAARWKEKVINPSYRLARNLPWTTGTNSRPPLEYLRPGEGNHGIHDAVRRPDLIASSRCRHHHLLVRRIDDDGVWHVARELLHRNLPMRSGVPVVIDAPCADKSCASGEIPTGGDEPSLRCDLKLVHVAHAALGSADYGFGFIVSAGSAIEDVHRAARINEQ